MYGSGSYSTMQAIQPLQMATVQHSIPMQGMMQGTIPNLQMQITPQTYLQSVGQTEIPRHMELNNEENSQGAMAPIINTTTMMQPLIQASFLGVTALNPGQGQMVKDNASKTSEENRVINLSPLVLNEDEISLLNKGLLFTPTPAFDQFTWTKDVNMFARRLALFKHFKRANDDCDNQHQKIDREIVGILEQLQAGGEGEIGSVIPPINND